MYFLSCEEIKTFIHSFMGLSSTIIYTSELILCSLFINEQGWFRMEEINTDQRTLVKLTFQDNEILAQLLLSIDKFRAEFGTYFLRFAYGL